MDYPIVPQRIPDLRKLIGPAVFLPCNGGGGGKGPIIPRWQELTLAAMTEKHLAQCERQEYRIGVVLGSASNGLCAIDCDNSEFADSIIRLNPWLEGTLVTTCNRGCTIWIRITGGWPASSKLIHNGIAVGEWRADGNQSIIAGQDTATGNFRRFIYREQVLTVSFRLIRWPDTMQSGGTKNPQPWPPPVTQFINGATVDYWPLEGSADSGDVERASGCRSNILSTSRSTSTTHRETGKTRNPKGKDPAENERAQKQKRIYNKLVGHLKPPGGTDKEPGERNAMLTRTVPYLLNAVDESLVRSFLLKHYDRYAKELRWRAPREQHEREITSLIDGCLKRYPEQLTDEERGAYNDLPGPKEKSAFRIARDLAGRDDLDRECPKGFFLLAYGELAARLAVTNKTAETIVKKILHPRQIISIEVHGTRRSKGQPGLATKWRWSANEPF